jgi:hypothetical protein
MTAQPPVDPRQPQQQAAAIDLMTYEPPNIQASLDRVSASMQANAVQSTQPAAGVSPVDTRRAPVPIFDPGRSS